MTRQGLCAALAAAVAVAFAGTARSQNLIPDPAFSQGVGAWSAGGISGGFSMTFAPGFSKRSGSGSALLAFDSPASGVYSVCVNVTGGQTYEWGYSIFFPDPARTTGLYETLSGYSGAGCTGSVVGGYALGIVPGATNVWGSVKAFLFPAPANCRSILVGFGTVGVQGLKATAYVDDVYLALAGSVPPIDPPAPAPALSTLSLIALGGALALAGARVLKA